MCDLVNPVELPLREIVPPPGLFRRHSERHGQKHVARVMLHGFRLLVASGNAGEGRRLWAAIYLHDLERTHDGICPRHGRDAAKRLDRMPAVLALFRRAGLGPEDLEAVKHAVSRHCGGPEPAPGEAHRLLVCLLKDADGLDRVRLGDLDPTYFRLPETPAMVPFAERLYVETNHLFAPGDDYFERLWPVARGLV
jgi:hypothetical protein